MHFILNLLPMEYGSFRISYNIYKDKWLINKLLIMCVQEEEGSAHMVTHDKGNGKKGKDVLSKGKHLNV